MKFYHFSKFDPNENQKTPFQRPLDIFMQLLSYTMEMREALCWLTELDKEYELTKNE